MNLKTPFGGKIWLNDRGIKEAIREGLINKISEEDIQPATIDVRLARNFGIGSFERRAARYTKPGLNYEFEIFGDIKSSVRRNGLYAVHCPKNAWFMITNSSCQEYFLNQGESIGQIFLGGEKDSELSEFDFGYPVETKKEIERLIGDCLLEISKGFEIWKGFIVFHAGNKIFSKIPDIFSKIEIKCKNKFLDSCVYEIQEIPERGIYLDWPNSYNISLREEVSLSKYVCMQTFYLNNKFGNFYLEPNGVVDPGYSGGLCCQPLVDNARFVEKGDRLVLGKVLFYPGGVEREYGNIRRKSNFQNVKCD